MEKSLIKIQYNRFWKLKFAPAFGQGNDLKVKY